MKIAEFTTEALFDGRLEPVAVILSEADRENIANMAPGATVYACFPDEYDPKLIQDWLTHLKREEP